jgi:hypothetical protein
MAPKHASKKVGVLETLVQENKFNATQATGQPKQSGRLAAA